MGTDNTSNNEKLVSSLLRGYWKEMNKNLEKDKLVNPEEVEPVREPPCFGPEEVGSFESDIDNSDDEDLIKEKKIKWKKVSAGKIVSPNNSFKKSVDQYIKKSKKRRISLGKEYAEYNSIW